MRTKKDNLKARVAKLQGFASGNFGTDGTIEYLETRKYIGFHVVSMNAGNDPVTNIVWGQKNKR